MTRIEYLRRTHDLSQYGLAKHLGVSVGAVSSWERGFSKPNADNLFKLMEFFHVPLDALMGDEK